MCRNFFIGFESFRNEMFSCMPYHTSVQRKMKCSFGWDQYTNQVLYCTIFYNIYPLCKNCRVGTVDESPLFAFEMLGFQILTTGTCSDSSTAKHSLIGVSVTGPRRWQLYV